MKFGEMLNQTFGETGVGGLVGGVLNLFGGDARRRKLMQDQYSMQAALNEQAAKLNYEYGEEAAKNAFQRQLEMYQRSYKDQSYEAMRKQMEDAGLSVGLMYGKGASGGAGGSTSGAPMGNTGGAIAGDAGSMLLGAEELEYRRKELGLRIATMKADLQVKKAQANELNEGAIKNKEEGKLAGSRALTEENKRDVMIENMLQEGKFQWIRNLRAEMEDSVSAAEQYGLESDIYKSFYDNKVYGQYGIVDEAVAIARKKNELKEIISRINEIEANADLKRAEELLVNEKTKYYFEELMSSIAKNKSEEALNYAKKLQSEHAIGEYVNWQTYMDYGMEAVSQVGAIATGVRGGNLIKKKIMSDERWKEKNYKLEREKFEHNKKPDRETIVTNKYGNGSTVTTKARNKTK
ncbi:DNA pilot protein [Sigmofec virus UA08Rod_5365]|uniref:DNA pilot protein n=1 Tax=Sigmofec virus UA08Rod_5365 TaxID=2929422 RepID=A0A976R7D3_9VIRU|nr:DNA pilot protein [Sigmofec virus UA08Rod_5365]